VTAWVDLERDAPAIAAFARERVFQRVCFLATVRTDGSPRVHPVTPWIHDGRLLVRMYRSSPKGADLRRDARFALHSMMDNDEGIGGEVAMRGTAAEVIDPSFVRAAYDAIGESGERDLVLFEFSPTDVATCVYEGDEAIRDRWRATG
jgi:hypothetical protein